MTGKMNFCSLDVSMEKDELRFVVKVHSNGNVQSQHCARPRSFFPYPSILRPFSQPPRRANHGKYKLSRRKLVQRTLLILLRDNNYSLFLDRSSGNRFFSRLTGHFVDRAGDPSSIRTETIISASIEARMHALVTI